ncbi:hypothetical protein ACOSP7_022545 [Xanthoceras sorbifolium]
MPLREQGAREQKIAIAMVCIRLIFRLVFSKFLWNFLVTCICATPMLAFVSYLIDFIEWLISLMEGFPLEVGGSKGEAGFSRPRLPDLNRNPSPEPELPDLNRNPSPEPELPPSPREEALRKRRKKRIRHLINQSLYELEKWNSLLPKSEEIGTTLLQKQELKDLYL